MDSDIRYRILKILDEEPDITQRQLAIRLGISVGKANYCLRALTAKGFVKVKNFKNSSRKRQYMYVLTPQGIAERTRTTLLFLRLKATEFEDLRQEIDRLEARLAAGEAEI